MFKNRHSEELVSKKLIKNLSTIFDALLLPGHVRVQAHQYSTKLVGTEVLKTLKPLLAELDELGESLDRVEFVHSALNLLRTLPPTGKHAILQFKSEAKSKPDK